MLARRRMLYDVSLALGGGGFTGGNAARPAMLGSGAPPPIPAALLSSGMRVGCCGGRAVPAAATEPCVGESGGGLAYSPYWAAAYPPRERAPRPASAGARLRRADRACGSSSSSTCGSSSSSAAAAACRSAAAAAALCRRLLRATAPRAAGQIGRDRRSLRSISSSSSSSSASKATASSYASSAGGHHIPLAAGAARRAA